MKKRTKVIIGIAIALALLAAAAFALVGNYFYEYALKARRDERAPGVPQGNVAGTSEADRADRVWFDESTQQVEITASDGLRLQGYYVDAPGNRYALAVHGYTGYARTMSGFGERFYERGFSVLMPDCRGHGQSEGSYIGMGWPDRLDMLRWIDWIIDRDPDAEILLFGISMGGATVMMTSGEALPPQVKLIIEDCGYSSVWDEFSTQLREQFNLPPFPVLHAASTVTRLRAGYWLGDADAVKQVAKCSLPMLFIHGEADTFVPYWMLEPLYDAKPEPKARFIVPGAGHGAASAVDPEGYWGAVDSFIDQYM